MTCCVVYTVLVRPSFLNSVREMAPFEFSHPGRTYGLEAYFPQSQPRDEGGTF